MHILGQPDTLLAIAAEDPIRAAKAALAAPFLMAAHFCGFRPGYVFRFGPTGLGYYADAMIANGTIAPPKAVAEELEPEPEGAAEPGRACESEPSTLRSDEATPVAEEVQTDVGLIKKGVMAHIFWDDGERYLAEAVRLVGVAMGDKVIQC